MLLAVPLGRNLTQLYGGSDTVVKPCLGIQSYTPDQKGRTTARTTMPIMASVGTSFIIRK